MNDVYELCLVLWKKVHDNRKRVDSLSASSARLDSTLDAKFPATSALELSLVSRLREPQSIPMHVRSIAAFISQQN